MKKLAIALGIFLLLVIGVGFLALRNLNTYLADNRAWIEEQVQAALGRPVSIGDLRASLGWGVSARVRDLAIADDPAYSKESFLSARDARVRVKVIPLLSGRVEVGRIVIQQPEIRVIQSARGMNIDTLGAGEGAASAPDASEGAEPSGAGAAAVAIALFRIDDASLLYRDTSVSPASEVAVGGLDIDFKSDGDLADFRGRLEVDASTLRMRSGEDEDDQWEPLHVEADLEREGDVLHVRGATLRAADLRLDLEAVVRELSGTPTLEATFSSPGGEVSGVPFEGLEGALRYADSRASFESLALQVFGGQVDMRGAYNMRTPGRPSFKFDTQVKGVRLERAIAGQSDSGPPLLQGEIHTHLDLAGVGADWEAIRPGLRGSGDFQVLEGVLKDVNLAESALGGLTGVPGLSDLLGGGIREKYPALFGGEETRFDQIDARIKIGAGLVSIDQLVLAARDFAIRGAGQLSLEGDLNLPTRLVCSEALGLDLLERQEKLSALKDRDGRVVFPLRLRGSMPKIRAEPDVAAVAAAVGRQQVGDLLGRVLGSGTDEEAAEGQATESEAEGSGDSKELLKKGLDSLFGR